MGTGGWIALGAGLRYQLGNYVNYINEAQRGRYRWLLIIVFLMDSIYKFFYVIFLYYLRFKDGITWISTMFVIILCCLCLTISILGAFNLLSPVRDLFSFPGAHKKVTSLIFLSTGFALYWYVFSFILFTKLKVSKEDGTRPNYEFIPTRNNKITVVCCLFLFIFSPFIVKGVQVFLLGMSY